MLRCRHGNPGWHGRREIFGRIVQDPYTIGNRTIQLMAEYLRGNKKVLADGKIHIPSQVVTRENVGEYQRFLGKCEE